MSLRVDVDNVADAHLPEVEAYRRFVREWCPELIDRPARLVIRFMGFSLRGGSHPEEASVVIGDYPSASTGSLRRWRDWAKRNISSRPDIAVVCGTYARARVAPRGVPTLVREMGYFAESIEPRNDVEFDVVYAGTLRRPGVKEALAQMTGLGLRVAVASADPVPDLPGATPMGLLGIDDLYALYSRCLLGLNVVPDRAPFAYQASTKVIEYCAAGLGVVTTRTPWIEEFEKQRGGRFMNLSDARSAGDILRFPHRAADVNGLEWNTILGECGLVEAVLDVLESKPR